MKRTRRCRNCKEQFLPRYDSLKETHCQKSECFQIMLHEMSLKRARKQKSDYNKKSMTVTDWILKAGKTFNAFIRERDKGNVCISCQKPPKKKNAGHYHNANNHWSVRFNEDNVHLQCEHCNTSLSGNLINYRKHLLIKIGQERLDYIDSIANDTANFTIPEIKELLERYNEKLEIQKDINELKGK